MKDIWKKADEARTAAWALEEAAAPAGERWQRAVLEAGADERLGWDVRGLAPSGPCARMGRGSAAAAAGEWAQECTRAQAALASMAHDAARAGDEALAGALASLAAEAEEMYAMSPAGGTWAAYDEALAQAGRVKAADEALYEAGSPAALQAAVEADGLEPGGGEHARAWLVNLPPYGIDMSIRQSAGYNGADGSQKAAERLDAELRHALAEYEAIAADAAAAGHAALAAHAARVCEAARASLAEL